MIVWHHIFLNSIPIEWCPYPHYIKTTILLRLETEQWEYRPFDNHYENA
jgi:hypothetical protein